jgi:hypothetical protein
MRRVTDTERLGNVDSVANLDCYTILKFKVYNKSVC